jgi:UDP-GlcNAc:undecaprenyl-phosphate GlcNAc-1-phosphate transferase
MYALLLVSGLALALSLALTALCRRIYTQLGVVDRPDGKRKVHPQAVPRAGGVAVILAYAIAFGILLLSPLRTSALLLDKMHIILGLLPPVGVIFAVGLLDDLIELKPAHKLAGQVLAAILAWGGGIRIGEVAGVALAPWISAPLTIAWLVACTNALNLIDGLDGLAAGVGLFASVTMLVAGLAGGNLELALATAPMACALAGFLRYNFNPASIFLGDAGSLTIGFFLGCVGAVWTQKSATLLGIAAPVIALAVPILDTSLAILRRFLRRSPIFGADRGHIHHRLLDCGLTPRRAVLLLYGMCALAAALSLLVAHLRDGRLGALALLLFCTLAALAVQRLRYPELEAAHRLAGRLRGQLSAQVGLSRLERALAAAGTPDEYWLHVRETCRELGFRDIRLTLEGAVYRDPWPVTPDCWSVYAPLAAAGDSIQLSREFSHPAPLLLTPLLDLLRAHPAPARRREARPAA